VTTEILLRRCDRPTAVPG